LRILAYQLRGRCDVGDGELHRIARTIIKDNCLFDPPYVDDRMAPRQQLGTVRAVSDEHSVPCRR